MKCFFPIKGCWLLGRARPLARSGAPARPKAEDRRNPSRFAWPPTVSLPRLASWVAAMVLFLMGASSLLLDAAGTPATNGFWFVDLSPVAIGAEELAARQFSALPKGLQVFHDVPFRADRPVAVTGLESARGGEFFPPSIHGIQSAAIATPSAMSFHFAHRARAARTGSGDGGASMRVDPTTGRRARAG